MSSQRWPGAHPVLSAASDSYADRELSPPPPPSNSQILFPKEPPKTYSYYNLDTSSKWSPLHVGQPTVESYINPASSIRVYNLSIGQQNPRKPIVQYINDQYEQPSRYTTKNPYEQPTIPSVSTTRQPVIQYHDQFDPSGPPPTPGVKYATSRPILSSPQPGVKYSDKAHDNQQVVQIRPKPQIRNKPTQLQQSYTFKPVKEEITNDYYSSSSTRPHANTKVYPQQDVYYVASTQAPPQLEFVENPLKIRPGKNYYSHINQEKPDHSNQKQNHEIVYHEETTPNVIHENNPLYINPNINSPTEQYHYDNHKYIETTSRPQNDERNHPNHKSIDNKNHYIENESSSSPTNPSHKEYTDKPYHHQDDYYDESPKQKITNHHYDNPETEIFVKNSNQTNQKNHPDDPYYHRSTPKPMKSKNVHSDEDYTHSKPSKSFRGEDSQNIQLSKNQKRPEYFKGSGFKQSSTSSADYDNEDDDEYSDQEYYEKTNKNNSSDDFKPQYPTPPPDFYHIFDKYTNVENPFASVDFDFDKYLEKLSGGKLSFTTTKTSKSPNTIKKPQREDVKPETLTAPFFKGSDGNYYPNNGQVPLKPQGFHEQAQENDDDDETEDEEDEDDDDEDEEDYEDVTTTSTTTTTAAPPQMKYYIKRRPGLGVTSRPRPGTYTTRPEPPQPKETLKPDTSMRHDLIVTSGNALNGLDTKARYTCPKCSRILGKVLEHEIY